MHLILTRVAYTAQGTFGVLNVLAEPPFAVTLERRWLNNRASTSDVPGSCIPTGGYICGRVQSPRFGDTFEVKHVKGRSHILFHKGNLEDDSRGCILVGERFDPLNGKAGVLASADGFAEFRRITSGVDSFTFTIQDAATARVGYQEAA